MGVARRPAVPENRRTAGRGSVGARDRVGMAGRRADRTQRPPRRPNPGVRLRFATVRFRAEREARGGSPARATRPMRRPNPIPRAERTQSPAPNEPETRRRTNPIPRADRTRRPRAGRTRDPVPSEPERPGSSAEMQFRASWGRPIRAGCAEPRIDSSPDCQRAPDIIVNSGVRVLRFRADARNHTLAPAARVGLPGLERTRDPPARPLARPGPRR
jgi:hypothetical protein